MAGFEPIQTPNFAQAALGGYQAGRAIGQQRRRDDALAVYGTNPDAGLTALESVDPALASQLRDNRDKREAAALRAQVFAGQTAQPALGGPPAGTAPEMSPEANAIIPQPQQPQAPRGGFAINQEALQRLAQVDPEGAFKITQFAATAEKAQLEQVARHGELKALAATWAMKFPEGPQRDAAFREAWPELMARGFSEADLRSARLDNRSLEKDIVFGNTLASLTAQQRADRTEARAEQRFQSGERRAEEGMGIRREALGIARQRAAGAGGGGAGGGANYGAMDDAALLAIANGGQ